MAKAGRPKMPEGKTRAPGVSLRLTPDEAQIVNDAVTRSGISKSEFCRKALIYVAKNGIRIT